jgi:hypothetical protein
VWRHRRRWRAHAPVRGLPRLDARPLLRHPRVCGRPRLVCLHRLHCRGRSCVIALLWPAAGLGQCMAAHLSGLHVSGFSALCPYPSNSPDKPVMDRKVATWAPVARTQGRGSLQVCAALPVVWLVCFRFVFLWCAHFKQCSVVADPRMCSFHCLGHDELCKAVPICHDHSDPQPVHLP